MRPSRSISSGLRSRRKDGAVFASVGAAGSAHGDVGSASLLLWRQLFGRGVNALHQTLNVCFWQASHVSIRMCALKGL
jgi:hypothetical protein